MSNIISLRLNNDELKLIQEYVSINNLNMSSFIRDTIIEKIEDSLETDSKRIMTALKEVEKNELIDHEEAWKEIGI